MKNDFSITTKLPVEYSTKGDDYLLANEINANLYGAGGDDTIIGSKGRDTLGGGPGNDVLDGGPGKDMLYGHKGRDHFVIRKVKEKIKSIFLNKALILFTSSILEGGLLWQKSKVDYRFCWTRTISQL